MEQAQTSLAPIRMAAFRSNWPRWAVVFGRHAVSGRCRSGRRTVGRGVGGGSPGPRQHFSSESDGETNLGTDPGRTDGRRDRRPAPLYLAGTRRASGSGCRPSAWRSGAAKDCWSQSRRMRREAGIGTNRNDSRNRPRVERPGSDRTAPAGSKGLVPCWTSCGNRGAGQFSAASVAGAVFAGPFAGWMPALAPIAIGGCCWKWPSTGVPPGSRSASA